MAKPLTSVAAIGIIGFGLLRPGWRVGRHPAAAAVTAAAAGPVRGAVSAAQAPLADVASDQQQQQQPVSATRKTRILRGARQKGALLVDLSRPQQAVVPSLPPGVLGGRFRLGAEEVQALLAQQGCSEEELLQQLITTASQLARPPISSFHVGAVGMGASGALYVGVNLEFARLPLYNSVHAEQFLLVNALHHGERGITRLAVSAAPCGHCRQFYSELACAESVRFSFQGGTYSLGQLLPMRFKPADLLPDPSTPLLLDPQSHAVALTPASAAVVAQRAAAGDAAFGAAAAEALAEARGSYAPYSKCPAGAALVTAGGAVYAGAYLESAAYNPSLPPLQTAMVDAVIDGMPCLTQLQEVVLVELAGGAVRHAPTVRVMLEQVAPSARLTVLEAEWVAPPQTAGSSGA